jgi:hypothetical protein
MQEMPYTAAMRSFKALPILLLSLACAAQVHAQTYEPAVGDYVEVYRRTFGPKNHAQGKAALMKVAKTIGAKDNLVRMAIVGENASTGEIVALIFSNPKNRSTPWKNRAAFAHLKKHDAKPAARSEYKIFEVLDEGVKVKVGDMLKLYTHKMKPAAHDQMRTALADRMLAMLQKDPHKSNGYFTESTNKGEFLGIGFGAFGPAGKVSSSYSHLKSHLVKPVKRDNLKVIWVMREKHK